MSAAVLALAAAAATAFSVDEAQRPVLLDNQCPNAEWSDAAKTDVGQGVTLLAKADEDFLYLCWRLPPQSLGTLDFYVIVEGETSRDMHISAQVGDRWLNPDSTWSAFAWGEHPGWYGPPVAFAGLEDGPGGTHVARFADSSAREMQISRDISRGGWAFMFQLHDVGPGRAQSLTWPPGGVPEDTRTWADLNLGE